mmetsp:Transcript_82139/g.227825  ORF Transcript_82139/g.227825 Transcript_82139/m.227825 type:complete len:263 (-) Transcript_82139:279-1067(-)
MIMCTCCRRRPVTLAISSSGMPFWDSRRQTCAKPSSWRCTSGGGELASVAFLYSLPTLTCTVYGASESAGSSWASSILAARNSWWGPLATGAGIPFTGTFSVKANQRVEMSKAPAGPSLSRSGKDSSMTCPPSAKWLMEMLFVEPRKSSAPTRSQSKTAKLTVCASSYTRKSWTLPCAHTGLQVAFTTEDFQDSCPTSMETYGSDVFCPVKEKSSPLRSLALLTRTRKAPFGSGKCSTASSASSSGSKSTTMRAGTTKTFFN